MSSTVGLALAAAVVQVLKSLVLSCRLPIYYSAKVCSCPCLDRNRFSYGPCLMQLHAYLKLEA